MSLLGRIFTRIHPSWSVPVAAFLFFVPVLWVQYTSKDPQLQILAFALGAFPALATLAAGVAGSKLSRQRTGVLQQQSKVDWLNHLSGPDLAGLVAEFYRRQEYWVEKVNQDESDEAADLRLRRDGRITLVRCKYWRTPTIFPNLVNELFGELSADAAYRAVFITTGTYSEEAQSIAQGKHIELIDGVQLDRMLRASHEPVTTEPEPSTPVAQPAPSAPKGEPVADPSDRPRCPLCGSEMVLRWSKSRVRPGSEFWGCSAYERTGCCGAREVQ